jgi:D-alanyl-D-alanine carboxypeptidase/D-alanyl-D-alanine-endopeptidase (penicillin-binding protein 4)
MFRYSAYLYNIFFRFVLSNLLFIIFYAGCSTHDKITPSAPSKSNLDILCEKISHLISDPNLFNAQVGIYISSLDKDEMIFASNDHKLFISASNMKIFTTASALLRFEPGFRYKTRLYHTSRLGNGMIEGDLIVRGSGDPTLAARFSNGDSRNFFRAWADSLQKLGIRQIMGDLVGDESYFLTEPLGYGWGWDDEPFWYAAQISALSFNDNCIEVSVTAGDEIGNPPQINMSPTSTYFSVDNKAITTEPDSVRTLFLTRPRKENKVLIRNQIPLNKPHYTKSLSVEHPASLFMHVLKEVFEEKGIIVKGNIKTVSLPGKIKYDNLSLVLTHKSPPLSEIVKVVNKRSQNLYAEQLLVTLAAEYGQRATAATGVSVVNAILARMGISTNEFLMHDGSGLSRVNLISPNSVGLLLEYMAKYKYFSYFYESLPISGVDGTLKSRMKSSPAQGKVRAKTGYVGHVRNLSGYAETSDGENLVFSILVNNYLHPTPAINLLQDRICILLSNFSR